MQVLRNKDKVYTKTQKKESRAGKKTRRAGCKCYSISTPSLPHSQPVFSYPKPAPSPFNLFSHPFNPPTPPPIFPFPPSPNFSVPLPRLFSSKHATSSSSPPNLSIYPPYFKKIPLLDYNFEEGKKNQINVNLLNTKKNEKDKNGGNVFSPATHTTMPFFYFPTFLYV